MSVKAKAEAGRQANLAARKKKAPAKPLTEGQIKWLAQKAKADAKAVEFKLLCKDRGLPIPTREVKFAAPDRDWRADFGWEPEKLLLEVEGGAWSGGRHTRGSGYLEDMVKYNQMTLRGWRLVRVTPQTLCTEETISMLKTLLEAA